MNKIYTKKGDGGTSELFDGSRLPKSHIRYRILGSIDNLNAGLGEINSHLWLSFKVKVVKYFIIFLPVMLVAHILSTWSVIMAGFAILGYVIYRLFCLRSNIQKLSLQIVYLQKLHVQLMACIGVKSESEKYTRMLALFLKTDPVSYLENIIDVYQKELPRLVNFIVLHENLASCTANRVRTYVRESERYMVELSLTEKIDPALLQYINRLSDYMFMLTRYIDYAFNLDEDKVIQ